MSMHNSEIRRDTHPVPYDLLIAVTLMAFFLPPLSGCSRSTYSVKEPSVEEARHECIVLLHGLGRSSLSMADMQEKLTMAGYHTINLNYQSTRKTIEAIASEDVPPAVDQCYQFSPSAIHFVTHSMGGIIIRKSLIKNRPEKLGRIVMLSPPNQGSEVVDKVMNLWLYRWLNGPAGQQLSTAADSVPNQLGPVDYPVGIITGDRHAFFDTWFSSLIPGKDDGKVSVERAKIDGMTDFLVVRKSHSFIMDADYVQAETAHFLIHGLFNHQIEAPPPVSGMDRLSLSAK